MHLTNGQDKGERKRNREKEKELVTAGSEIKRNSDKRERGREL